jgi:hypothetical protein
VKGSERIILVALPLIALAVGFWLLVLAPKQKQAGELQDRIDGLNGRVDAAEVEIAAAEKARSDFSSDYADLVTLGTAIPEEDDQATLVHDLTTIGRQNNVSFRSFTLAEGSGSAATAAPAPTEPSSGSTESSDAPATPVAATPTEASAASLPIGATVGAAGLPVMPYDLTYFGRFYDMADVFADLDARVQARDGKRGLKTDGRLITIDGFSLTADPKRGFPSVAGDIAVTTFVVPPEQGIAAGANPAGPAPAGVDEAPVPVSGSAAPATGTTASVTP